MIIYEQLNTAAFLVSSQGTWDVYVTDSNLDDLAFSLGGVVSYSGNGRSFAEFVPFDSVRGVYVQSP